MGDPSAWIKDVSATYLDFVSNDFDAMLAKRGYPEVDGDAFTAFVGASPAGTTLYLYTTLLEDEVEVPVKRTREVIITPAEPPAPLPDASPEGAAAVAVAAPEGETKHGESKEEIAISHAADGEPRTELIEETVMELQRVARHIVSASLRPVPASVAALTVYFVKSRDGPIAGPGADETFDDAMTDALEFGSVNGDLLTSMVGAGGNVAAPPPPSTAPRLRVRRRARRSSFCAKSTSPSSTRCSAASPRAGARRPTTRLCPTGMATAAQ